MVAGDVDFGDDSVLVRYDENSELDEDGFGDGDGIVVVRYRDGGGVDTDFGDQAVVTADFHGSGDFGHDVVLQPNGKIVAPGHATSGFTDEFALIRIDP